MRLPVREDVQYGMRKPNGEVSWFHFDTQYMFNSTSRGDAIKYCKQSVEQAEKLGVGGYQVELMSRTRVQTTWIRWLKPKVEEVIK